jgi:hypothetical protein
MATDFLRFVTSCLPVRHKYALVNERVDKKDDDHLAQRVEEWKAHFPVGENMTQYTFDHKGFASRVVKGMLDMPVNETTAEPIGEHLHQLALKSSFLRDSILSKLAEVNDAKFSSAAIKRQISLRVIRALCR